MKPEELRDQFHQGIKNESSCKALIQSLEQQKERTSLEEGYLGASLMVSAQYEFWPAQKLASFSRGKQKLESAIKQQPNLTELRYLRYIIQVESPAFLNYRSAMPQDKSVLMQALKDKKEDAALLSFIGSFLKRDKSLTESERRQLIP